MPETIRGLKELKKKNEQRKKVIMNITKSVVLRCANDVKNTAQESIKQKGTGRTYRKYNPNRTHTASAPNMPPATDTGFLGANISLNVEAKSDGSVVGQIISAAPYSKALEFGTTEIVQRPFMRPALHKNRKNIREKFKKAKLIKK